MINKRIPFPSPFLSLSMVDLDRIPPITGKSLYCSGYSSFRGQAEVSAIKFSPTSLPDSGKFPRESDALVLFALLFSERFEKPTDALWMRRIPKNDNTDSSLFSMHLTSVQSSDHRCYQRFLDFFRNLSQTS
jgi:hypothetical protein